MIRKFFNKQVDELKTSCEGFYIYIMVLSYFIMKTMESLGKP